MHRNVLPVLIASRDDDLMVLNPGDTQDDDDDLPETK
jgi:hypothetical protein